MDKMVFVVSRDAVNGILWEAAEKLAKLRIYPVEDIDIETIFNALDTPRLDGFLGNPDYSYN